MKNLAMISPFAQLALEVRIPMIKLLLKFIKLGFISFGGGYAIIPLLYDEIYDIWSISRTEFANLVGLFELTPGSLSVNAAGYVGFQVGSIAGATLATLGIILPSFVMMLVITAIMRRYENSAITASVLRGVRPAAMGIMCSSLLFFVGTSIVDTSQQPNVSIPAVIIALLSFAAVSKKNINPIWVTVCAGILGVVLL